MPHQFAEPLEHPGSRVTVACDDQAGQLVVRGLDLGCEAVILGHSPVAHRRPFVFLSTYHVPSTTVALFASCSSNTIPARRFVS